MIALVAAAIAAVVFSAITGQWAPAIGVGIAYALAGLVWLEVRWHER
jgi:hypothetical protein